jgi:Ca2+/Na+ antiporter
MSWDDINKIVTGWISKVGEIKLPPGVLGKTSKVIAITIITVGALAFLVHRDLVIWVIGGILLLVLIFMFLAFLYAHLHPNHALLEGANLLRAIEADMSAKDITIIDNRLEAPLSPPPAVIRGDGGANG